MRSQQFYVPPPEDALVACRQFHFSPQKFSPTALWDTYILKMSGQRATTRMMTKEDLPPSVASGRDDGWHQLKIILDFPSENDPALMLLDHIGTHTKIFHLMRHYSPTRKLDRLFVRCPWETITEFFDVIPYEYDPTEVHDANQNLHGVAGTGT